MKFIAILFAGVMLSACAQNEKETSSPKESQNKTKEQPKNDSSMVIEKPSKKVEQLEDGRYIEYYPDNSIHIEGQLDEQKRKTGVWKSYRVNGALWSETNFKNGKKNGSTVSYHKNGMVYYSGEFTDDKKSGTWTFYDEKGNEIKTKKF